MRGRGVKRVGWVAVVGLALLAGQAFPAGEWPAAEVPVLRAALTSAQAASGIATAEVARQTAKYRRIGARYPWRNAPYSSPKRQCFAYVEWRLSLDGIDQKRYRGHRPPGEVVDKTPAVGAVAEIPGHVMYVEYVGDGFIIFSDYNAPGRPFSFGVGIAALDSELLKDVRYVHYELPHPRFPAHRSEAYQGARFAKLNRNAVTVFRALISGTFIRSPNGRHNLVVEDGRISLYDAKAGDRVRWGVRASKRASWLRVVLGRGEMRGKNRLVFGGGRKAFRTWHIGPATRIEIADNGRLIGRKGKRKVWEAVGMPGRLKATDRVR